MFRAPPSAAADCRDYTVPGIEIASPAQFWSLEFSRFAFVKRASDASTHGTLHG
jgi:hypothetical protein